MSLPVKKDPVKDAGWSSLREDYKLVKHIGEGSFGAVFLGQHRLTKRMVAIKLIKDFTEYEYATIKVAREILIMKEMSDKVENKLLHIPRLFDLRATSYEKIDQKTKKPRNREPRKKKTKKPENQGTKKIRNQNTTKPGNQKQRNQEIRKPNGEPGNQTGNQGETGKPKGNWETGKLKFPLHGGET